MENHPIPQDVTGFQFKLIGNMTVKQFGYLAFGAIFAVICYYAPLFVLIKFPLVVLFATTGVCLAFVPIEGRPMDQMLSHFIKALIVPNQYIFLKTGGHLLLDITPPQPAFALPSLHNEKPKKKKDKKASAEEKAEELEYYIHHLPRKIQNALDEKEKMMLQSLPMVKKRVLEPQQQIVSGKSVAISDRQSFIQQNSPVPEQQPYVPENEPKEQTSQVVKIPEELQSSSHIVLPDKNLSEEELEKEAEKARQQLGLPKDQKSSRDIPSPSQTQPAPPTPQVPTESVTPQSVQEHEKTRELEDQLHDIAMQKQQLEDELLNLKKQLSQHDEKKLETTSVPEVQEKKEEMEHVRKIPINMARSVGLPNVPDVPNLVTGIVKDPRGNVLPHILVEIKDNEGNPVRAFKTNTLGQFASATPLSNGTYTIEFEDAKGQHTFDIIELTASGKVILPIEIISHDAREELRKALFN